MQSLPLDKTTEEAEVKHKSVNCIKILLARNCLSWVIPQSCKLL